MQQHDEHLSWKFITLCPFAGSLRVAGTGVACDVEIYIKPIVDFERYLKPMVDVEINLVI